MTILQNCRAVITGGAGLVGSTIADQLVDAGAREIVVLDNFVRGRLENLEWAMANGPITVIEGDIRDRALLGGLFRDANVVFHQAAIRINQCAEEPRLALEVLVDGTFNVLEAAVDAGVGRVVAASSASVYGQAEVLPTSELHHPYGNRTFYGSAKTFLEGMLRSFHDMHGLDYVALRYFNVYGRRMDVHGVYTEVLVRWMERLQAGLPPLVFGDGTETMDLVYIADVARANLFAAEAEVTDAVYNVGSGRQVTMWELAQTLARVMDRDIEPEMQPAPAFRRGVRHRLADVTAAAEDLGFVARVTLEQGLSDLVEWWRAEKGLATAGAR